jgi:hypothetical protein
MRSFFILCVLFTLHLRSQDTVYARQVIKKLTSERCYGRGYLKHGLDNAADIIVSEIKSMKGKPLFDKSYFQDFYFDVNTFPGKMSVKIDGKELKPGADFIPEPESGSAKGKYTLMKKDSVTWIAFGKKADHTLAVNVSLKKKLTFSVGHEKLSYCSIELLNKGNYGDMKTIELEVDAKLEEKFRNRNICAYLDGKENNDTMIVFSAHYDHLGGIGKSTYFPGANDNASGVSMVLNFLKYYSVNPPRYKTLFIFFAGEEAGLIGSMYFVKNNTVDLKKIKFLVNLDLLGTGDDGIMVVNGAVLNKEFETLAKINEEKKLVKEVRKRGKAHNSDHYWFTEAGVPAFFIYTLGGTTSYHDIYDTEKQLPLTDYEDVFRLLTEFVKQL